MTTHLHSPCLLLIFGNSPCPDVQSDQKHITLLFPGLKSQQLSQECTPKAGPNLKFNKTLPIGDYAKITFRDEGGLLANYSGALNCTWTFNVPDGGFLVLTFSHPPTLNYDCSENYIKIQGGTYNEDGGEVRRYCGYIPDNKVITSLDQQLVINFYTAVNKTRSNYGFEITVRPIKRVSSCAPANFEYLNLNIRLTKGPSGVFTSPGYGVRNYLSSSNCRWRLLAPKGYIIKIKIKEFDLEPHSRLSTHPDELDIYDGSHINTSLRIGAYHGHVLPPDTYSSGKEMTISFFSNIWSDENHKGFLAQYYFIKTESTGSCAPGRATNTLGGLAGTFTTPNYPQPFPKKSLCYWKIQVPSDYHLKLSISYLEITQPTFCSEGYFSLEQPFTRTLNSSLGRFCNAASYPKEIYIRSNVLWACFLSDLPSYEKSSKGVRASYEAVKKRDEVQPTCSPLNNATENNFQLTSSSGIITSPNYPANYPLDMTCTWTISAPPGRRVKLTMKSLDIGPWLVCRGSYLQVRDGGSENSTEKGKFCSASSSDVYSSGRDMWLRFHSDNTTNSKGFSLNYNFAQLCDSSNSFTANNDIRFTAASGNFTSPNYPGLYPINIQCTWKITVPDGKRVRLRFTHFAIETSYDCLTGDYVMVRDGLDVTSERISTNCGYSNPGNIYSSENNMWVRLKSDYALAGTGFRAEFEAVDKVNVAAVIGGAVVGAIAFLVIVVVAVYCYMKRRPRHRPAAQIPAPQPHPIQPPAYPRQAVVNEPPAVILHGGYPQYPAGQHIVHQQQQPSPILQQRSGPCMAAAFPTQPAPYPGAPPPAYQPQPPQWGGAVATQQQPAPYSGAPSPDYQPQPPQVGGAQEGVVPPTASAAQQQTPLMPPAATQAPNTPTSSRAPLLTNEEVAQ